MALLGWILFGIVVALFARAIMPERYPMGVMGTTALGVIGAMVFGWLGEAAGWYGPEEGLSFIVATVGAILTISFYHRFVGRKAIERQVSSRETQAEWLTREEETRDEKKAA